MSDSTAAPELVTAADIAAVEMPAPTAPAPSVTDQAEPAPAASQIHAPESALVDKAGVAFDPARHVRHISRTTGRWLPLFDKAGVAFDPARHVPHISRTTGRWLPRGGRKKAKVPAPGGVTSPGAPAPASSAPPPRSYVAPDTPPPATASAGSGAARSEPAAEEDHSADAGEVLATGAQFVAGLVFDAPEECAAAPTQHRHMVTATAAWLRARGTRLAAGAGVLLMFAAWLLATLRKPKVNATVRRWLGQDASPKPAAAVTHRAPATPAASPPAGAGGTIPAQFRID